MKILTALGLVLIFLLEVGFYILFELQNGWPFNKDVFICLQILSLLSIMTSLTLAVLRPVRIYSAAPLLISFLVVSAFSRASLSMTGLIANILIIISIFLIALLLTYKLAKYNV